MLATETNQQDEIADYRMNIHYYDSIRRQARTRLMVKRLTTHSTVRSNYYNNEEIHDAQSDQIIGREYTY